MSEFIKKYKKQTLLYVFFAVIIGVYYFLDPSYNSYFLKCPLKTLTGYECAGCGSQRAFHELLHFRLISAFKYNPLFVIALPIVLFVLMVKIFGTDKSTSILSRIIFNKTFIFVVLIIVLLFSRIRNSDYYNSIINQL